MDNDENISIPTLSEKFDPVEFSAIPSRQGRTSTTRLNFLRVPSRPPAGPTISWQVRSGIARNTLVLVFLAVSPSYGSLRTNFRARTESRRQVGAHVPRWLDPAAAMIGFHI
jgi:hypothetical protein